MSGVAFKKGEKLVIMITTTSVHWDMKILVLSDVVKN